LNWLHFKVSYFIDLFLCFYFIQIFKLKLFIGRINHTFKRNYELVRAFKNSNDDDIVYINNKNKIGLDETSNDFKFGRWCYDTPGTIQPDQILQFLTTNELLKTLPNKIISPRTFCIWSGETIFIGGLGRLDILSVPNFIR
jgi:hypothetical protein